MKECYVFSNDKTLCSGCGSCAISCRHNALKMIEDEEGFLYPVLDKNKCINLGLMLEKSRYEITIGRRRLTYPK